MITREEISLIGKFNKPHGINGEISATINAPLDVKEDCSCIVCDIEGIFVPFFINEVRRKSQDNLLITVDGINNEQDAMTLVNRDIYALSRDYNAAIANEDELPVNFFTNFKTVINSDYKGSIVVISHDRYFINKLADRILYLDESGMREYTGNYDYYVEKSKSLEKKFETASVKKNESVNAEEYRKRKELQSNIRKLRTKIQKCEADMTALDELEEKLQLEISEESTASDFEKLMQLTCELEKCQKNKDEIYECWEMTQLELEKMEKSDKLN